MAAPTAPDYDNVRWGGPDGLRVPTEMGRATLIAKQRVTISATSIGGSVAANTITLVPYHQDNVADIAGSGYAGGAEASLIIITNGGTATTTVVLPAAFPGHFYMVKNSTGNGSSVTFKVLNQSGVSIADGSHQLLYCDSVDVAAAAAAVAN